ncbi:hypothetical protein AB0P21_07025 [Kribbella sp. NPDC056861]|uniref:hypothetical protein n=1 Tax=Kribbella sp. NPDC056861 TaxID=3154857 RepID=UPI003421744D
MTDALAEASAGYFLHRAAQFKQCLSRPDDFMGDKYATPEEIAIRDQQRADRDARLRADIERCRLHAGLLAATPAELSPEVVDVLREVA